jgi:hypothetical protein
MTTEAGHERQGTNARVRSGNKHNDPTAPASEAHYIRDER